MNDTATLAMAAIGSAIAVAEMHASNNPDPWHKQWVIDQMVRALTGVDYPDWRAAYEADGEKWDEGVAPDA